MAQALLEISAGHSLSHSPFWASPRITSKTINVFLGGIELSAAVCRMSSIMLVLVLVLNVLVLVLVISRSMALPNAVKHYVAKLVM